MHTISTKIITRLGFSLQPIRFSRLGFSLLSSNFVPLSFSRRNLFDRGCVCAKPLSAKPLLLQPSSLSSSLTEALFAPILCAKPHLKQTSVNRASVNCHLSQSQPSQVKFLTFFFSSLTPALSRALSTLGPPQLSHCLLSSHFFFGYLIFGLF